MAETKSSTGLKPLHKALIGLAVMVLIGLGFYFLVISEAQTQIKQQKVQKDKAEKEIKEYESLKKDATLDDVKKQYADLQKKWEEGKKLIPDASDRPGLNVGIETDARKAGLHVSSLKPIPDETYKDYMGEAFEYVAKGTFADFVKFLYLVSAEDRRLVNIKKMTVKRSAKAGASSASSGSDKLLSSKILPDKPLEFTFTAEGYVTVAPAAPAQGAETKKESKK